MTAQICVQISVVPGVASPFLGHIIEIIEMHPCSLISLVMSQGISNSFESVLRMPCDNK